MSYNHEDIWSAICKLRQKIHNIHKAVRMVDDEAKSRYTRALGEIDRLERRVEILEDGNRDPDARPIPEEVQIQILGDFLLEEIPNGIMLGETVCDATIRVLRQYQEALVGIRDRLGPVSGKDINFPALEAHALARNTLQGK